MYEVDQWVDLVGASSDYLIPQFILTKDVTPGLSVQFRVRARNIYGWQELFSDPVVTLYASEAPGQLATVTTAYNESDDPLSVLITWEKPDENSEPISAYEILILAKDGQTWNEETLGCDGEQESIVLNRQCYVLLSTLRESPFNLVYDDLVIVKGRAKNSKGFGHYSEPNIFGARISQIPITMDPPRVDVDLSTLNSITVDWDALTLGVGNGGSAIDSYNLIWDAGTNGQNWLNVQG